MKTITTSKRLVSILLALIMVVSMCTVAFVNTFAAETDLAETSATQRVYFQNNWLWTDVKAYCWDTSNTGTNNGWPGKVMTKYTGTNNSGNDIYYFDVDSSYNAVIFSGIKNDGSGARDQSPDITSIDFNTVYSMTWSDGNQVQKNDLAKWLPDVGGTTPSEDESSEDESSDTPSTDPVDLTTICFRDDYDSVDTADANVLISFDGGSKTTMIKCVDTMSGHDMWYADVPESASSVSFYRANPIDDTVWNTWTASMSGNTTGLYRATGWGTGSWGTSTHYFGIPNKKDINELSFGIWADTRDNGNIYDAVIARKVSDSEFHLYLPSNTPDSVKLYTSFASLTLGNTTVTDGTAVTLEAGSSYSMSYKQTQYDSSNKSATLKVYRTTNTATLIFQTKRDLYTDLTTDLVSQRSKYKDLETKGSYYIYGEDGTWENAPVTEDDGTVTDMSVLKKIKGRGNSSFEASMKLYGKYAYNFNLDEKIKLIDGSTASKKWCLLANNVDHSMMRNTFIYQLADELGLKYAPETRLVDVYDNGYYLGAYVITEKVEYGKNTMMKDMKNLDDGNEDANIEAYANEDIMDDLEGHLVQAEGSVPVNGQTYTYQYTKSDDETNWPYHQPSDYTEYNYLLEFELYDRYKSEASWFVSPRTGQAVVVKYPEFATKDEMEWIISEFDAAESAIYANDTDAIKAAVDVDSFAKMYLLQELSINLDSCATSYYIHNDLTSGKLVSSPVWDYDWAFGAYAKDLKYIYNGSSVTTSANMSDPKQMFVKNKALKTDASDTTKKANYNFQAKLVHNDYVWERCQYFWTNQMADLLYKYVKDDSSDEGIIIDTYLPQFESAVNMNNKRWGSLTYEGDDWGTKVTSDYNAYSYNFYIGNCYQSGTSSASYANTVYYLNDWIKTRRDYMSSSTGGGLYDATLLEQYEITDVTFTGVQDSADDTQLTVTPSATITKNGEAVTDGIEYTIYVNGKAVGTYDGLVAQTITLSDATNEVYVVVGIKDTDEAVESAKQTFGIYVAEYKVSNVKFEATQSDDESTVTVTPYAIVTLDGEQLKEDKYQYTVYLNGKAYVTNTFVESSVDVTLEKGIVNEIYIKVTPVGVDNVSGTSAKQSFSYEVAVSTVAVTFNFKSSSSLRYVPSVTVGDTKVTMTRKNDGLIGKNASQTQSYYWFEATVDLPLNTATKVTFTNSYAMNATATVTATVATEYYYGVDNLNNGATVVDLTDAEEYVRNFKKSASHMVYNAVTDGEIATTSINGKMLKMGDSDGDNKVTVIDATNTQMALAQKTELTETGSALADYNLDGENTILDVTMVQTYLTQ